MIKNPAMETFVMQIKSEFVLAQVLIQRTDKGFELRHTDDARQPTLKSVASPEIRQLALCTASGEFRPLKSAPTLSRGWRLLATTAAELEFVLNQLYPGAIADWYAVRQPHPPITHYRDYVNRQTGMYRLTAMLNDAQVAGVMAECCGAKSCLKLRLWSVAGVGADASSSKSVIPCLEPCALLMEAARKSMRAEQTRLAAETGTK